MAWVIAELLVFFALLSLTTTVVILLPGAVRARIWFGLPLGALAAAGGGAGLYWLTNDLAAAEVLAGLALVFGLIGRILLSGWSYLAALLMVAILFAGVYYLVYSVLQAASDPLGPIVWLGSVVLLLLEVAVVSGAIAGVISAGVGSRVLRSIRRTGPSWRCRSRPTTSPWRW